MCLYIYMYVCIYIFVIRNVSKSSVEKTSHFLCKSSPLHLHCRSSLSQICHTSHKKTKPVSLTKPIFMLAKTMKLGFLAAGH